MLVLLLLLPVSTFAAVANDTTTQKTYYDLPVSTFISQNCEATEFRKYHNETLYHTKGETYTLTTKEECEYAGSQFTGPVGPTGPVINTKPYFGPAGCFHNENGLIFNDQERVGGNTAVYCCDCEAAIENVCMCNHLQSLIFGTCILYFSF